MSMAAQPDPSTVIIIWIIGIGSVLLVAAAVERYVLRSPRRLARLEYRRKTREGAARRRTPLPPGESFYDQEREQP